MRNWHFRIKSWQEKLIDRGWRSDPITIGVIAIIAGAAVGGAAVGGAFSGDKKAEAPSAGATPAVPSESNAAQSADALLTQQRRTALLSGGQTNLTGAGGAPLLAGDTTGSMIGAQ